MVASLFLGLLALVTLMWFWLNISPTMRENTALRLDAPPDGRRPADSTADADLPHVTILCPGRNEASFIPTTLPELCGQDYPRFNVVYIDDHSSDETPAITAQMTNRYPHLFVLRNEIEPPIGWVGKCWAIKRGYDEWIKASTENGQHGQAPPPTTDLDSRLVCFTDADVNWHPQCLRMAVDAMRREKADVVSLFPGMVFGSAIERIILAMLTFALLVLFPIRRAMDPKHPDTLTAGAFILTRRGLYDRIGGHESVRSQVVEDINLGRKLKAAGGKVWIAFTRRLISCRMYEGWSDIWEGLTKNAYAGMEYKPHVAAYLLAMNLIALTLTPLYLLAAALWLAQGGGTRALAATALAGGTLLLQARLMNQVRRAHELPARYALSIPLGAAIYFPIAVASVWRYYRGGNLWKGRSYGKETVTN
jgi:chlorobactene glucosyltransferase